MKKMEGIIIPCVTPFDEMGELRLDWLEENYKKWNQTQVNGFMVLGSNGEFRSLSDQEAFEVIQIASQTISPEKIFIAGVGRESLYHTLQFIKQLADGRLNIDYVSVLTPCYFKKLMTDRALITYYTAIADASPYPVLLYCAPGFANGVKISVRALKILADHPNIAGIKDTSTDMMDTYMDVAGGRKDFQVFAGSLGSLMACMERGGKGGIISCANYFPKTCSRFYQLSQEQGLKAAAGYLERLKEVAAATGGKAGVAGVKAVMNLMNYQGGAPRQPVLPCDNAWVKEIQEFISNNRDFIID